MAQASVYVIQSDDSLVHGAKPTPIAFLPLEPGRSSNSSAGLSHRGKGSGAPARPAARRDPLRVTQSPTLLRAGGSRARGEAAEKRQSTRKRRASPPCSHTHAPHDAEGKGVVEPCMALGIAAAGGGMRSSGGFFFQILMPSRERLAMTGEGR